MSGTTEYNNNFITKTEEYIEKYANHSCVNGFYNYLNLAPSTTFNYIFYITSFLNETGKEPETLILDDYTKYLKKIKDNTASYQIAVYSALKKFSLYLCASEINTKNPMAFVERPKAVESINTINKRKISYLEDYEIEDAINAVIDGIGSERVKKIQKNHEERNLLIIYLFLTTGMRCAELYKLDIDSIDFNEKQIVTMGKGEKIQRHALSDEVFELLEDWLYVREYYLDGKEESALFISQKKNRMSQKAIRAMITKFCSVERKKITPHKLRATYGSQLYDETHDLYFVQKCMGHSDPRTTEIYIRGQESSNRKKAADMMSSKYFIS